MEKQCKIS